MNDEKTSKSMIEKVQELIPTNNNDEPNSSSMLEAEKDNATKSNVGPSNGICSNTGTRISFDFKFHRVTSFGSTISLTPVFDPNMASKYSGNREPSSNNEKQPQNDEKIQPSVQQKVHEPTMLPIDFKPANYDVICALDNKFSDHVGNRRFRMTIMMQQKKYLESKGTDDLDKLFDSIISLIQVNSKNGGGFIGYDDMTGRWYQVSDRVAKMKVLLTFAEVTNNNKKKTEESQEKAAQPQENPAAISEIKPQEQIKLSSYRQTHPPSGDSPPRDLHPRGSAKDDIGELSPLPYLRATDHHAAQHMNHVGNHRFREMMKMHYNTYNEAKTKLEQVTICRLIVEMMRNNGTAFVCYESGRWIAADVRLVHDVIVLEFQDLSRREREINILMQGGGGGSGAPAAAASFSSDIMMAPGDDDDDGDAENSFSSEDHHQKKRRRQH
eukprot:CAMPEP_0118684810 /NCGR_PEP_ID=MMETSP0800-20121206/6867_1 /TAXON_ID=210618 ORGANISM="Striatella unipunctata, Strain CCMP2910" /NCGR_SAMPLE_ID=MMETSP0800 /ASSEMBLY_ACC=CAM_ASM_000638 /LENGTH=439 /DNA_ID=CAMNT_0006581591 /DNA_START=1521 /DNA_END=2839 /DNA_ORIENTATION=+